MLQVWPNTLCMYFPGGLAITLIGGLYIHIHAVPDKIISLQIEQFIFENLIWKETPRAEH